MANNVSARMLRALVELANCGHFSRAAERSNLSPSAFSKLIRRLESEARVQLVDRDTRNVSLTGEGELLAERARHLLQDIDASFAELRDRAECRAGRVSIAALPSLAAHAIPRVYAQYAERFPNVSLHLFDRLAEGCVELVREGRVDFALTAPVTRLAEFDVRELTSEHFYLVCPRAHPLARKRVVRLAELRGVQFIHMARTSSVRQHVDPVLRTVGVEESSLEVEHLATLAGLIANGLGVSLVPELTLFHFQRRELAVVPLDASELRRPMLVVRRKGVALSPPANAMLELIEDFTMRARPRGAVSGANEARQHR